LFSVTEKHTKLNPLKKLASETAIYGISTILGRLLNWLLVPLYTYVFIPEKYGIVVNMMSYVAILLVLLTYGMETGFFRFANAKNKNLNVFSTGFLSLLSTTIGFWFLIILFLTPLAEFLNIANHKEYILLLAFTIGLDAITALPFAKLRQENRPIRYAGLKLVNIFVNIGLNLFFLLLCPYLSKNFPELGVHKIWNSQIGIGYIFISYFVASLLNLILLLPDIFKSKFTFDFDLLKQILKYSAPILIVSLCGMININLDKLIMPELIPASESPLYQTGIYGANYKLALIMSLFIQAFRFAFEPFFFSQSKDGKSKQMYADVLKYFVVFGMFIFLGVLFYIDIVKIMIDPQYYEGLHIVPYILMANFFFGIFFSLSLWYKLTDKTHFGAFIALVGSIITIVLNIVLVPKFGYIGAAYAVLICFVSMTIISYLLGQKHYPIPYDLKNILFYISIGLILYGVSCFIKYECVWIEMLIKTPLLLVFILVVIQKEKLWNSLSRIVGLKR